MTDEANIFRCGFHLATLLFTLMKQFQNKIAFQEQRQIPQKQNKSRCMDEIVD